MPDGILPTETTAPELAAETADSRMVQHVRRNLVLWSGGTTLVILLILAAALYVANPAMLYDVAHWAQPDGAHSLFTVLAVGWLDLGYVALAWAAMALAALAKPQAWTVVPLLALAPVRVNPAGRVSVSSSPGLSAWLAGPQFSSTKV